MHCGHSEGLLQRPAAQEDCPEVGGLVKVGELGEGPAGAGEEEVGALAWGDGAGDVAEVHRIGAVQGDGVQRLGGGEAHPDAAEGHHEAHVAGRGRPGVVVPGTLSPRNDLWAIRNLRLK